MSAVRFFFKHAGYSYNPATESSLQGRWRCARELAAAEMKAREAGISFIWRIDPEGGSAWATYYCVALTRSDEVVASLGDIDFGPDGSPDCDPYYSRVIEAQLALEALT